MGWDPLSWALGFAATSVAGKFLERSNNSLIKRLRKTALKWERSLPSGSEILAKALFSMSPSIEEQEASPRKRLAEVIEEGGVPTDEQWLNALMERWREVNSDPEGGEVMPFFHLEPGVAQSHLGELAKSLTNAMAQDPPRANPEMLRILRSVAADVSDLKNTHADAGEKKKVDPQVAMQTGRALLKQELESRIGKYTGTQEFSFTLNKARSFTDLVNEEYFEEDLTIDAVIEDGDLKRTLLVAPGGWGKTSVFCRLGLRALELGFEVFYLDLTAAGALFKNPEEFEKGASFEALFDKPSQSRDLFQYWLAVESETDVLLLVDGLNEIYRVASDQILEWLNREAVENAVRVFAADRLTKEREGYFTILGISALSENEVRRHLGELPGNAAHLDLLRVPFFLDLELILRDGGRAAEDRSRHKMLEAYFVEICEMSDEDLTVLCSIAFEAYEDFGTRSFSEEWLAAKLDTTLVGRLETAGVLVWGKEREVRFRHQLLHDYLVGRWLAESGRDYWTPKKFDASTFRGNSPESLYFAAEIIGEESERFLLEVYDWNYSMTFFVLADLQQTVGSSEVEEDLGFALTALYAEKKFDSFETTVENSSQRLRQLQVKHKDQFVEVSSIYELLDVVENFDFSGRRYEEWQQLFCKTSGAVMEDEALNLIIGDPLFGWTAANVYRRVGVAESYYSALRTMYFMSREKMSHRWRIVHLLGKCRSDANIGLLWKVLLNKDEVTWVRYGALRSLIEIAYEVGGEERRQILSRFVGELDSLASNSILLRNIGRTPFIRNADQDWYESVLPLVRAAQSTREAEEEAGYWEDCMTEVEKRSGMAEG